MQLCVGSTVAGKLWALTDVWPRVSNVYKSYAIKSYLITLGTKRFWNVKQWRAAQCSQTLSSEFLVHTDEASYPHLAVVHRLVRASNNAKHLDVVWQYWHCERNALKTEHQLFPTISLSCYSTLQNNSTSEYSRSVASFTWKLWWRRRWSHASPRALVVPHFWLQEAASKAPDKHLHIATIKQHGQLW
jgi:hypothetical protein